MMTIPPVNPGWPGVSVPSPPDRRSSVVGSVVAGAVCGTVVGGGVVGVFVRVALGVARAGA